MKELNLKLAGERGYLQQQPNKGIDMSNDGERIDPEQFEAMLRESAEKRFKEKIRAIVREELMNERFCVKGVLQSPRENKRSIGKKNKRRIVWRRRRQARKIS